MEDTQWDHQRPRGGGAISVLILVVMEDTQWDS